MAKYLANRIIEGALDYTTVVTKKPSMKTEIDAELTALGRADLIK